MGTFLIFVCGAACTYGLVKLNEIKPTILVVICGVVGFFCMLYLMSATDALVIVANTVSLAVLCFVPVSAVLLMKRIPSLPIPSSFVVAFIGGFSAAYFQYAGFFVSFVFNLVARV
ncbi:MAG: hypothetical protein COB04_14350 [Gammaproteobacteria bacterium]|nr:MAG: hypothetical protein COB04_14350 [Gammaproteobacteria bacterium]